MTAPIYAKDVPVKTKTVEIKVIQVGSKQMTLAMFKQLPEKAIIDHETGELMGLEWGRVCGVWAGCCREASYDGRRVFPHDHIIWEHSGILYKWSLWREPDRKFSQQVKYLQGIDQLFIGA